MAEVKLTHEQVRNLCLMGQGPKTCSFLMYGPRGFACSKGTELQPFVENRRETKTITAMGDNCDGPPSFTPKEPVRES